jgi:hypothetical protein
MPSDHESWTKRPLRRVNILRWNYLTHFHESVTIWVSD